jgi:hypothetical protein
MGAQVDAQAAQASRQLLVLALVEGPVGALDLVSPLRISWARGFMPAPAMPEKW